MSDFESADRLSAEYDDIRAYAVLRFNCHAREGYFLPWEDIPQDIKDELDRNGGIPCEGEGAPGDWCTRCRFGSYERLEDSSDD